MILDVVTNHHRALPGFCVLDALNYLLLSYPAFLISFN